MIYIDENGDRYVLVLEPGYKVWYVLRLCNSQQFRVKEIPGSKDCGVAEARLVQYALKHGWVVYPDVVCGTCMQRAGTVWPTGHIATFYPGICGLCGELVTVTEMRDWRHAQTQEEYRALYRVAKGMV